MTDETGPKGPTFDALQRWLRPAGTPTIHTGVPGHVLELLRNVPPTVSVSGATLAIETYLWRDFEPICPPEGHGLMAIVRLHGESPDLLADTMLERIMVIHDDKVWMAPAVEEKPRGGTWYEAIARNGPTWGPGIRVDVVVQFTGAAGRSYLVRSGAQHIDRTD